MRALTRPFRAAVLTVATLLAYGTTPAHARPAATSAIAWATCPEDAQVQCGTLTVPADWANPTGPVTTLTMARRRATDPARRIGVLLVNPGGPGGSAVDFTFNATTFFGEELRRRFDIVGVDPRGVGRSSPILCSRDLVDAQPSALIETEQQYAAMITYNRRLAADCAARAGPVFGHVDTRSVVRDFDTVRAALGEQKITFYGSSYGTLIGLEYARLFPDRLRGVVLDSVMDHSADLDRFLSQSTAAVQDSFDEFVKWCARDTRCVLRGQNIPQLFIAAMARARAGELLNPYDPPNKLTVAQLTMAAYSSFYQPQWYSLAYYLRDAMLTGRRAVRAAAPPVDLIAYSFAPIFCEDWHLPITGFADLQRRLRTLAAGAPQMLVSPLALLGVTGCLGWPSRPDDPRLPPARPAGPSVLLVNSRHDPATSYTWARLVTARLGPSARLLTYDGWGHVAYTKSPCVAAAVDKYLLGPALPAAGARCPAVEPPPFGVG